MDMQILPWIKDDIAIEIIGKMIAEQVQRLNEIVDAFELVDMDEADPEVQQNSDYLYHSQRIQALNAEIQQLYRGENKVDILRRVNNEYAPYIKGRFKSNYTLA